MRSFILIDEFFIGSGFDFTIFAQVLFRIIFL